MANEYTNKVVLSSGETLIDLTADTADAAHVLSGYTFHDKSGAPVTGTNTFDSDTGDDTAAVAEILVGKTAHARGAKLTGTMPNNGAVSGEISTKDGQYTIPQGYHDGAGKVGISASEQAKIIPGNIKAGVEMLGVTGLYGGESINAQAKSAVPSFTQQTIQPDAGYDYLSAVTVAAIPVAYADNAAGGRTVTIGSSGMLISFTIDGGSDTETFSVAPGTTFEEWIGNSRIIFNGVLPIPPCGNGQVFLNDAGDLWLARSNGTAVYGSDEIINGETYVISGTGIA